MLGLIGFAGGVVMENEFAAGELKLNSKFCCVLHSFPPCSIIYIHSIALCAILVSSSDSSLDFELSNVFLAAELIE
jgi:hypothetical protein